MKKLAVAVIGLLLGVVSPAHAIDFRLESYMVTLNDAGPGLVVWADDLLPVPFPFSLTPGQQVTKSLFHIGTLEQYIDDDDWRPYGINVNFAFDMPSDVSGTVWGISGGGYFGSRVGELGYVLWDNPLEISFGTSGTLAIYLSHEKFGVPGQATVEATFLLKPATTVPEPSSLALLGIGLAAVAVRSRRRTVAA